LYTVMMVSRCVALTRQVPLAAGEYAKYSYSMPDAQLSPSTAGLGAMQCVPGRTAGRHLRRRADEGPVKALLLHGKPRRGHVVVRI